MAPAANHKGSEQRMGDTFVLSNISPQARLCQAPASEGRLPRPAGMQSPAAAALAARGRLCKRCVRADGQVGADFNRNYWARFEKYTKDLTKRYSDVFVVTGPLFLPVRRPPARAACATMRGSPPGARGGSTAQQVVDRDSDPASADEDTASQF